MELDVELSENWQQPVKRGHRRADRAEHRLLRGTRKDRPYPEGQPDSWRISETWHHDAVRQILPREMEEEVQMSDQPCRGDRLHRSAE